MPSRHRVTCSVQPIPVASQVLRAEVVADRTTVPPGGEQGRVGKDPVQLPGAAPGLGAGDEGAQRHGVDDVVDVVGVVDRDNERGKRGSIHGWACANSTTP